MGKILAFSNQKGGIGKTTSAVSVAAALASMKKKVLLCDMDPQGNATSGVGIAKKADGPSIYGLLVGEMTAEEAIMPTEFQNLSILASNIALAGAEVELVEEEKREFLLKNQIDTVKDQYDYIIVDCPPSLGILTINALTAADGVIIPMTCEYYALEGLSQLMVTLRKMKKMYNPDLEITGILITMYDKRLNLSRKVLSEIEKYYKDRIFNTKITRSVRLTEAPSFGMPICYYDKSSKGAYQYHAVAKELIKRI